MNKLENYKIEVLAYPYRIKTVHEKAVKLGYNNFTISTTALPKYLFFYKNGDVSWSSNVDHFLTNHGQYIFWEDFLELPELDQNEKEKREIFIDTETRGFDPHIDDWKSPPQSVIVGAPIKVKSTETKYNPQIALYRIKQYIANATGVPVEYINGNINSKENKMITIKKITIGQKVLEEESSAFVEEKVVDIKDPVDYRGIPAGQALAQYILDKKLKPEDVPNLIYSETEEKWSSFD